MRKLKKSWFWVNKIYLIPLLLSLLLVDAVLFLIGFAIVLIVFIYNIMKAKVPIEPEGTLQCVTHIYKKVGNTDLKLDIWYPNKKGHAHPLVFFAHGGGWISGFRNQPKNVSWCKFLASKGFAAASIDYRYGIRNSMEEILTDYSDGLEFIKENAIKLRINRYKIVLMGLSAGGHLALLYASYYTYLNQTQKMEGIRGVCVYYAPSNLMDLFAKDNKSILARFATMTTLKGVPNTKSDLYYYYSPIEWISERMVPTAVVHGREDTLVPYKSSVNLVRKLKAKKVPCKFFLHKRGGHSFETHLRDFQTVRILEETVRFIKGLVENEN
jgi:acetyl esterase/lipase